MVAHTSQPAAVHQCVQRRACAVKAQYVAQRLCATAFFEGWKANANVLMLTRRQRTMQLAKQRI